MRFLSRTRKASRFVVGGGTLLLALSLYSSTPLPAAQTGRLTSEKTSRGTLHTVQEFGSVIAKTRRQWRETRAHLRNRTAVPQVKAVGDDSTSLALRSAQLSATHLEIAYHLPVTECVSLWTKSAAHQQFERLSVIGGIPCSMATGPLSARLLLTSMHPEILAGQLIKMCTNSSKQCSQPIAIATQTASAPHSAADTIITVHSASIIRNSMLSVTYSKTAGCVRLVRWNGIRDSQNVKFANAEFSCDAVQNATTNIATISMQPVLGSTQWMYLCDQQSTTACSNVIEIR